MQSIELAIERVKSRVLEGGHNIDNDVIKRRYINGIKNLFDIYVPIIDEVLIFDNSEGGHDLLAIKHLESELIVLNEIKYKSFRDFYHEKL